MLDQSYEQVKVELFDVDSSKGLNMKVELNSDKLGKRKDLSPAAQKLIDKTTGDLTAQRSTMVIDEASVEEIERNGYPKPYIMASLNNDDLNHVTTFYYLL